METTPEDHFSSNLDGHIDQFDIQYFRDFGDFRVVGLSQLIYFSF